MIVKFEMEVIRATPDEDLDVERLVMILTKLGLDIYHSDFIYESNGYPKVRYICAFNLGVGDKFYLVIERIREALRQNGYYFQSGSAMVIEPVSDIRDLERRAYPSSETIGGQLPFTAKSVAVDAKTKKATKKHKKKTSWKKLEYSADLRKKLR